MILYAFVVILDAIGKEIRLGADMRIQSGEHKCTDIIAQPFRADVTIARRTGVRDWSRRR